MDDQKLFNRFVDFFRESLEDGWIKDFFSWLFWGIGISVILKTSQQIHTLTFFIFSGAVLILWIGYGLAVFDKTEDFLIKKYEQTHFFHKVPLFIIIIVHFLIFILIFSSTNQLIDFLIKIPK